MTSVTDPPARCTESDWMHTRSGVSSVEGNMGHRAGTLVATAYAPPRRRRSAARGFIPSSAARKPPATGGAPG